MAAYLHNHSPFPKLTSRSGRDGRISPMRPPMQIGKTYPGRLSVVGFGPGVPATGASSRVCLVSDVAQTVCANHLSGLSRRRRRRCGDLRSTRPKNRSVPPCRPTQRGDLLVVAEVRVAEGQLCSGSGEGQTESARCRVSGGRALTAHRWSW